ncbi:MAG: hypothetical protein Q4P28_05415, partial [Tissierellia bacterium]|nr:hypothetical protein [Tissierellia bacterium]
CMVFISSSTVFATNIDEPISTQVESQDELSSKLSSYFTEDSNGDIHFTATKADLISLGISEKDAEIMLSFSSEELNSFSEELDSSLVIGNTNITNNKFKPSIQPFGFVGIYLKLGPKVRSMAAVPAGAFAAGFVGWYLKDLAKAGPWGAGAAAAISASVGGAVGWAVKNHLKVVPVGKNIAGVSWSRSVNIP